MPPTVGSQPLIALSAVVLDTETTGLDPRSDRLVQIGAVRIELGALSSRVFETLVHPGGPIPPAASAIHGITDADVADAPLPAVAIAALRDFAGDAPLIGHTLSFDLAVLNRQDRAEAGGASVDTWLARRTLDVRLLARVAEPSLTRDDLDSLCTRYQVPNPARHTAVSDATATALVFLALLPGLRERGIRTLAEAEVASRRLMERDARAQGGLIAPPAPASDAPAGLSRIDSFPYRHRVSAVMSAPPLTADASLRVTDALALLIGRRVSSVFVRLVPPGVGWGIVTERDLLLVLHDRGPAGFGMTLGDLATRTLESVDAGDHVYRAIGRMTRLGVRHLGVLDATGTLVGALTPRNLMRQRATTAIVLGDQVDCARNEADLATAWALLPGMVRALLDDAVDPRDIAGVISAELRAMTRRCAELAVERMAREGFGPPPVPFCVLVLGSAGRGESLMAADQDNAIVFAEGDPGSPADRWFATMAGYMNLMLDAAGVPLCKGGVMARETAWRLDLKGWAARIEHWVRRHRPDDLLNVDIFFDLVPAYGDRALADTVLDTAWRAGRAAPDFLKLMAVRAGDRRAPLTFLGRVRTDEAGRVDVKRAGLLPIFSAARVLAIRHGVRAQGSADRVQGVLAAGVGSPADAEAVLAAHRLMMEACLRQQLADAEAGVPLSPRVAPASLPPALRQGLPGAFRAVATIVDWVNEGRLG